MNISPLDENGHPVDWWFIYKVPEQKSASAASAAGSVVSTGYEYVYYDPRVGKIAQSKNVLNQPQGALNLTLNSVFGKPDPTTGWILYNDERPKSMKGSDNDALGHTKGVIAFDTVSNTAFWMIHSWPHFAEPGATAAPTPIYGQTFICVALDLATASKLAAQMANHQEPQVFLPRVPGTLAKTDPLFALTQPLNPSAPADHDALDFKTRGGLPFKVIAKNRKWNDDFWNDLVGPTLKEDMDVETWIRVTKTDPIPDTKDNDGIHSIVDVKFIDLRPLGAPWVWSETRDHAKWGITTKNNWVCVGDINRMVSQRARGGGTIAFQDVTLWTALSKTDFIKPPPGKTVAEAKAMIKATHPVPKRAALATTAVVAPAAAATMAGAAPTTVRGGA